MAEENAARDAAQARLACIYAVAVTCERIQDTDFWAARADIDAGKSLLKLNDIEAARASAMAAAAPIAVDGGESSSGGWDSGEGAWGAEWGSGDGSGTWGSNTMAAAAASAAAATVALSMTALCIIVDMPCLVFCIPTYFNSSFARPLVGS
ncbi:hypothetical protein B0H14DRAFT_3509129 [Mycena olivaceomarginata]|nr:hypothetical protein B0H14DRAFT_3509129 [Mycena olivaceomarginata]